MVAKALSIRGKKVKSDGGEQVGFQNHEVLPWQPLKFRFWSIGLLKQKKINEVQWNLDKVKTLGLKNKIHVVDCEKVLIL